MILYDFCCLTCHQKFEKLIRTQEAHQVVPCPRCQGFSRKVPSFGRLSGVASAGPDRQHMPRSWRGLNNGDPSTIAGWRELASKREKLEEKYPELAGDRRPVLAHEGPFASVPLRDGDPLPKPVVRDQIPGDKGA